MTKMLLTYAVGHGFDTSDADLYVNGLADPLDRTGTWPELLTAVAKSQAFRTNRGELP
jgi:hypothetical protein